MHTNKYLISQFEVKNATEGGKKKLAGVLFKRFKTLLL